MQKRSRELHRAVFKVQLDLRTPSPNLFGLGVYVVYVYVNYILLLFIPTSVMRLKSI